jgi:hypothetical protein
MPKYHGGKSEQHVPFKVFKVNVPAPAPGRQLR